MPSRPALPRRAVVARVEGEIDAVEAFRREHDPLGAGLRAHVTLIFPFASSLTGVQVATHVRRIAAHWPVLPITLAGVDAYQGQWVHLRLTRGCEAVVELHDRLYRGTLAPFLRAEFDYEPHVTLGRARDAADCEAMLARARLAFARPLDVVLRSLAIVALPAPTRVEVEGEIGLGA